MDIENFPSPIAISYLEAVNCNNIQLRLRALIASFGVALKYCALVTISNYLEIRKSSDLRITRIDSLFGTQFERPSLGHWNSFIRIILTELWNIKKLDLLFIPEFFDFYFKSKESIKIRQSEFVNIIDEFIFIRNKYVHPDIYPQEAEAIRIYYEFKVKLDKLLEGLNFLTYYPLIKVYALDNVEHTCIGSKSFEENKAQKISYYIKASTIDIQPNKLPLGDFIYSYSLNNDEIFPILLYDSFFGKKIKYVLSNYYILTDDQDVVDYHPVKQMQIMINQLSAVLDHNMNISKIKNLQEPSKYDHSFVDWNTFQSISDWIFKQLFYQNAHGQKFAYNQYVQRQQMDNAISDFLKSTNNCFALVADSGMGKTNLFCWWQDKLLKEGNAVFFIYGRDYNSSNIDEIINLQIQSFTFQSKFKDFSFPEFLERLYNEKAERQDCRKIVILIDAINESEEPEVLLEKIIQFAETYAYPWLKVLFSIRTFSWENISDKYLFDKNIFYYNKKNPEQPLPYFFLSSFSEIELNLAFDRYKALYSICNEFNQLDSKTKAILTNPLLLRFACESYEGKSIPKNMSASKIFDHYQDQRINRNDNSFLEYLAEAMFILKKDEISFKYLGHQKKVDTTINPIAVTSKMYSNVSDLSIKLSDYIYEEPVYEYDQVYTCTKASCPNNKKELFGPHLTYDEESGLTQCGACHSTISKIQKDYRTTYCRLISENIIQLYFKEDECIIHFTYDRFFEFFIGKYIKQSILREFRGEGGQILYDLIEKFADNHIFWGAIKNVLNEYLIDDSISINFWLSIFDYSPNMSNKEDVNKAQHIVCVYRQLLSSTFSDFYIENRTKAIEIIQHISNNENAKRNSVLICLEFLNNIVHTIPNLSIESAEIDVLKCGLHYPDSTVLEESSRIVAVLFNSNKDLAFKVIVELKDLIKSNLNNKKILLLILNKNRKRFVFAVECYLNILTNCLGANFSSEEVRHSLINITGDLFDNNVLMLADRLFSRLIAKKLAMEYWVKGFPCNYLEIHLSLRPEYKSICTDIGNLFIKKDFKAFKNMESKIFDYCQINNGLISWYLYSLFPIYALKKNDTDEVLDFIEKLYLCGNIISQYIAQKSLWILATFSDLPGERHLKMFENYSKDFLNKNGGYIEYSHKCECDEIVISYIKGNEGDSLMRSCWGEYKGNNLCINYDNSVLKDIAEYQLRNLNISKFSFLEYLLDTKFSGNHEFLFYAIKSLGQLGSVLNPAPILNTLQYIIDNHLHEDIEISFENQIVTIKDMLIDSLLRIKSFNPNKVNYFIDKLELKHQEALMEVRDRFVEKRTDYFFSYYGEAIYQKSFLYEKEFTDTFGRGIIRAGSVKNVNKLFIAYTSEFFIWFKRIRRNIKVIKS